VPLEALAPVVATVQRNCDLADALHAQDLSLCTYLLEMREFCRWDRAWPLGAPPDRASVGRWIAEREARWQALADAPEPAYAPLPIAAGIAPFDEAAANAALRREGLVYGAGLGRLGRPEFFLADLDAETSREGARVVVTGREFARGMSPVLAASRGDAVLVRRDVLRRWLWTRVEVSDRPAGGHAFGAALAHYEVRGDRDATVEAMVEGETETLILHELGERRAAALVGPGWEEMLAGLTERRSELVARAVRDLLADCLLTLPALLERDARASVHFWFAGLEGLRRLLAGELLAGYAPWGRGEPAALLEAIDAGRQRWGAAASALAGAWRDGGEPAVRALAESIAGAAEASRARG
jgi:hypothetical protein